MPPLTMPIFKRCDRMTMAAYAVNHIRHRIVCIRLGLVVLSQKPTLLIIFRRPNLFSYFNELEFFSANGIRNIVNVPNR